MLKGMRFTGAVFLLAGTILYGMIRLAIALYMPQLHEWSGTQAWYARVEIGASVPYYVSIAFILLGVFMLAIPLYYDLKTLKKLV